MRILSFAVENYKCFGELREVALDTHMTLIMGANNVGKTAFLESMFSADMRNLPNKIYLSKRSGAPLTQTLRKWNVSLTGTEFSEIMMAAGGERAVPFPPEYSHRLGEYVTSFLSGANIAIEISFDGSWKYERFEVDGVDLTRAATITVNFDPATGLYSLQPNRTAAIITSFSAVAQQFTRSMYMFKAHRRYEGISQWNPNSRLEPDASNLPSVLLNLRAANSQMFDVLFSRLREIFPDIRHLGVEPLPGSSPPQLRVLIWETEEQRPEFAFELHESGAGVTQVIAMLYVALSERVSRTILIDEPNSFLHPGAAKKLLRILSQESRHQFVITTHSQDLIAATGAKSIELIRRGQADRVIERLNVSDVDHLRATLDELGVRAADLFGVERILWVEGQSEEIAFPRILSRPGRPPLSSALAVLSLVNASELSSKRMRTVLEIYRRLSEVNILFPPAIAYSVDREDRSDAEIEKMRSYGQRIEVLPRRALENYLLRPEAIAALFNSLPSFYNNPVSEDKVESELRRIGGDPRYKANKTWKADIFSEGWLRQVDAARLLQDLLTGLSIVPEEYRKTTHSVALVDWLLKNDVESISELTDYVDRLVYK